MSRDLDCQYKSAWVLVHKIRGSLLDDEIEDLDGEVEVDATYVKGHMRPSNRIEKIVVVRPRCYSFNCHLIVKKCGQPVCLNYLDVIFLRIGLRIG